jgi:hypothetical protein
VGFDPRITVIKQDVWFSHFRPLTNATMKNQIYESSDFNHFFFSLLATENLTYHFFFEFLVFNFVFWPNFASEKIG